MVGVQVRDVARVPVEEASQISEVRRLATALARGLGFKETDTGKVAIVASEIASNLDRHAHQGEVFLRCLNREGVAGVEILALDRGPGMRSVTESMRDGHSTAGSQGIGLGAVNRLSSSLDLYSLPEAGTAIVATIWSQALPLSPSPGVEVTGLSVPKPGEDICGDAWFAKQVAEVTYILIVDGLGHGPLAAEAAQEAVRVFAEVARGRTPAALLEEMNGALRHTRGAAGSVAAVNLRRREVQYAGIGNVRGVIKGPEGTRQLVSHDGILGHNVRTFKEFTYPWPAQAVLVLATDGLDSRWDPGRYPGLAARHPSLVAGVLFRDHRRENDDATVVVAREQRETTRPAAGGE